MCVLFQHVYASDEIELLDYRPRMLRASVREAELHIKKRLNTSHIYLDMHTKFFFARVCTCVRVQLENEENSEI